MSDIRIQAAAQAMREKRRELQHLPLDRIYEELADAAVIAFMDSIKTVALSRAPTSAFKVMADHFGLKETPTNKG